MTETPAPAPTVGDLLSDLADAVFDLDRRAAFQAKLEAVFPRAPWHGREPTADELAEHPEHAPAPVVVDAAPTADVGAATAPPLPPA